MAEKNFWLIVVTIVVIALLVVGYWYGQYQSNLAYERGVQQNQMALKRSEALRLAQQKAAQEAAAAAAKAVTTFKVDAFAQAKEALNPFK